MLAEQMREDRPAQSIPFKDLPISGKIQQAAQAGIELKPEDIIQQIQLDMAAKQKNEPTKQAG
jgi:hypothetical protein